MELPKAKVIKVVCEDCHNGEVVLFENGVMKNARIEGKGTVYPHSQETPEQAVSYSAYLDMTFYIKVGDKIFYRTAYFRLPERKREVIRLEDHGGADTHQWTTVFYEIRKGEYKPRLLAEIQKLDKEFCLIENELIREAVNLIIKGGCAGITPYKHHHLSTQVEIGGCIADGLLFLSESEGYTEHMKIVGLEAKTNKDNYLRLYDQVNAYLNICDYVYLIIEDKKMPLDLPFYVGVIRVKDGVTELLRGAQTLKHIVDAGECWKTLLKSLTKHVGLPNGSGSADSLLKFFYSIESIKRKLIWNQFVLGYHQTYVKEYVPLSDREKRIIRTYFGGNARAVEQMINMTLDNFNGDN